MRSEDRLVLRVFLGSPGDLSAEREAAKDAIDRLNISYGRTHGVSVELLRWEDLSSGRGRPQSIINQELLKSADLFVGLIWKKWGSATGEYSSGFEEEFTLAMKLKNIADVSLFFKTISESEIELNSEDIQKVTEFKRRIIDERSVLFKEFKEASDWKELFYHHLLTFCGKRLAEQQIGKAPARGSISKIPGYLNSKSQDKNQKPQLVKTILASVKGKKSQKLDQPTRARLFLLSSALLYNQDLKSELVPTHELNLLFKNHKKQKLIPQETHLVLRSIVEDEHSLKPGWYWLKGLQISAERILLFLANYAQPDSIRVNALTLLAKLNKRTKSELVADHLSDENENVAIAAAKIIERWGDKKSITALDPMIASRPGDVGKAALKAKLQILARLDKSQAIELLSSTPSEKRPGTLKFLDQLLNQADNETWQSLEVLLKDSDAKVRTKVLERLADKVSETSLKQLSSDKSDVVRALALAELIRRGTPVSLEEIELAFKGSEKPTLLTGLLDPDNMRNKYSKEHVIKCALAKLSKDDLIKKMTWYGGITDLVYETLLESHFGSAIQLIISDVENDFARFKNEPIRKLHLQSLSEEKKKETESVDFFVQTKFLSHIAKGISKVRESESIRLARLLVTKPLGLFRSEVIATLLPVFDEFGTDDDFKLIWAFKDELHGDAKREAVRIAFKFAPNKKEIIATLLDSSDPISVGIAMGLSVGKKKLIPVQQVKSLLGNPNEKIRLMALAFIVLVYKKENLHTVLDDQLAKESYYYNVVCYLDRLLYAPPALRALYRAELLQNIVQIK